jgi:transcriptional regulator with XRE-family HTH domain
MATKPLEVRSILSKNVKEQRKKLGLSQEKLAELTGLSVQAIHDIEGCRKWVSDKTITKLTAALRVETYQLFIPEYFSQNKKNKSATSYLMEIKKKLHKNIDIQIDEHFNEFIKSGNL